MKIVRHISHSVFQENTYILYKNDHVLIIDPGDEPHYYDDYMRQGQKPIAVLATHGHIDHIAGASRLCEKYDCPFIASSRDRETIGMLELACERYRMPYFGTPEINRDIADTQTLVIEDFTVDIIPTPGHTPGSLCFLIDDVLFSGDTLFHRSIGRTDLPGGDHEQLRGSVKRLFDELPNDTIVYPGHMEKTVLGDEKKFNPFIVIE